MPSGAGAGGPAVGPVTGGVGQASIVGSVSESHASMTSIDPITSTIVSGGAVVVLVASVGSVVATVDAGVVDAGVVGAAVVADPGVVDEAVVLVVVLADTVVDDALVEPGGVDVEADVDGVDDPVVVGAAVVDVVAVVGAVGAGGVVGGAVVVGVVVGGAVGGSVGGLEAATIGGVTRPVSPDTPSVAASTRTRRRGRRWGVCASFGMGVVRLFVR